MRVYFDTGTITKRGQHVLQPCEDSSRKKFAFVAKLAQCRTGPYKILFVSPGTASRGEKVGPNLLLMEVRKDEPGREIAARVSMYRCKKCYHLHKGTEGPQFLPWAMSSDIFNKYTEPSPPFHLTAEDV